MGFKNRNGNVPVFDSSGILLFRHIEELAKDISPIPEYHNHLTKQINVPVKYGQGLYFVKFFKYDVLVPLYQVEYVYDILY